MNKYRLFFCGMLFAGYCGIVIGYSFGRKLGQYEERINAAFGYSDSEIHSHFE